MTNEEIIQCDKLIAEFMGLWEAEKGYLYTPLFQKGFKLEELEYYSSWDWLMPVVHKCLKYCHENMLDEWENSFVDKFLCCDIEPMYHEVVEFIKWYNKNNTL